MQHAVVKADTKCDRQTDENADKINGPESKSDLFY